MRCREVHEKIEGYYEGVLSAVDERGVDIHLVQCPVCHEELGGVEMMVGACGDAFETKQGHRDLDGLKAGMDAMADRVAQQERRRDGFNRRDVFRHVALAVVAIPTIWFMSSKAVETYSAVSEWMLDDRPAVEQTLDTKISPVYRGDRAGLDW